MGPKTDQFMSLRAVRQLRRVRGFYLAGVLLWAAAAAWTGWAHTGSRQMWMSMLLLAVFTGLLCTATVWLRRLKTGVAERPVHKAVPKRAGNLRQA